MELEELKGFAIEDEITKEKIEPDITLSTDELDKFDFSSDQSLDIDRYHELISFLKETDKDEVAKELIKLREAKNIIEKDAKIFLDPQFVDDFAKEEENLINMIKKYDPNQDIVRNMSEEDKDKLFDIAQYLFNVFQKKLNDLIFIFPLTKNETKFVYDVFRNKLEYDQNEIFQLKELKEHYLDKEDFEKLPNGDNLTFIKVNDLIVFYHLISKYKVKGINKEHYDYLQVLTKIGERIKLFNAYNVIAQRLSTDFQIWGGALTVEGELSGKVLEPVGQGDTGEISLVNEVTGEKIK